MDYIVIIGIAVAVILILVMIKIFSGKSKKSEISIANVRADKKATSERTKKTPLYYIKYKGNVKLGIEFKDLDIDVNNDKKIITILVPEAMTLECNVNAGKMDALYIDNSEKKKSEKNFIKEGYEICSKDMEEKISSDEVMLEIARNNTKQAISALIIPLVNQIDKEYKVEIKDKQYEKRN